MHVNVIKFKLERYDLICYFKNMGSVLEIEQAIEKLPETQMFQIMEWLEKKTSDRWDKQFNWDNLNHSRPMRSRAVSSFWLGYHKLPAQTRRHAVKQYNLWLENPSHPSVNFKKVGKFWSARVTGSYRAVGVMDGDTIIWFFIGTHAEYDKLLS